VSTKSWKSIKISLRLKYDLLVAKPLNQTSSDSACLPRPYFYISFLILFIEHGVLGFFPILNRHFS